MELTQALSKIIPGEVWQDEKTREAYSRDASLFQITPRAVIAPRNPTDLGKLVTFVTQHADLSLTARSGGSDMTGGPLTDSIVLDMNRHFNRIGNIGDHEVTLQPGVFYRDLETALAPHNLLLPCYPASKSLCTVGGMVANNSGGEKSLTFGKTDKFVKKLKVILHDGNEYVVGPLTAAELKAKLAQAGFEGDLYRQVFALVTENYDRLQKAKPRVSKNSAGYALWDIWDKQTFDLTKLFVGSQGTLGLITEITFKLVTPKPHSHLLVIFMRELSELANITKRVLTYQPETFESYDDHTLSLALRFLPDLFKRLRTTNTLKLLLSFLPEIRLLVTGGLPRLVLLAEFTGYDSAEVWQRAKAAQAALKHLPVKMRLVNSETEIQKYWTIRRESFNLLRQHVRGKHTAPFIDDVVVRPEQLPSFLPQLNDIMDDYDITYTIAGHVGDANFHIIPLMDTHRADFTTIIQELGEKVYALVSKFDGSITGEHNDGLIRSHYLKKMYGAEVYALFEEIKTMFDPHNIFNPGKKVAPLNSAVARAPITWETAKKYLAKD